jgi:proteasome lid subunit RPN8/RPN11
MGPPSAAEPSLRRALEFPAPLRAQLEALACARYPREACGLLLGRRQGGHTSVVEVREARNLCAEGAGRSYELDPAAHLAAEERAQAAGLAVVGVWHSHPDRPAVPSEEDLRGAWPGWSYAIVAVAAGAPDGLRAWRLEGARFAEEEVRAWS